MLFKVKYLMMVVLIVAFATVSFAQTPAPAAKKDVKAKPFNYAELSINIGMPRMIQWLEL